MTMPAAPEMSDSTALVVLVGEDGQVENRVLTLPPGVPSSALMEATNFLNARIRGRTLAEARLELETALTEARTELDLLQPFALLVDQHHARAARQA
jgi:transcriptional regulator of heat shock response